MIWLKRNFMFAEFGPYQDKLGELQMQFPTLYSEFIMVSVETKPFGSSDYFVGLPNADLARFFDGFERVDQKDLPTVIDSALFTGDQSKPPFAGQFTFRHNLKQ